MSFEKRRPDFDGGQTVQIWKAVVENGDNKGEEYLKVRILGHVVNCFQVKEKKEEESEEGLPKF